MINRRCILLICVFATTILPGSPLVRDAIAQCDDLTEYVDIWDDADEVNDTLGFFARGTAEAGEGPCDLTVRTYIKGPDGSELVSAYGYGPYIATSTVAVYLDLDSAEGQYDAKTEAWSGNVHFGCSLQFGLVSIVIANYIKTGETQSFCGYQRCDNGNLCPSPIARKSKFPNGVCPTFARIGHVRIDYGAFAVCLGVSPTPISSCAGAPENASVVPAPRRE